MPKVNTLWLVEIQRPVYEHKPFLCHQIQQRELNQQNIRITKSAWLSIFQDSLSENDRNFENHEK